MALITVLLVAASAVPTNSLADEEFDLVILGGRVMDPESNFDAVRNVGVRDGKIVMITENNSRARK